MHKEAYNQFADLIQTVLKNQGYSEDVQRASYSDIGVNAALPSELRNFMYAAGEVWQFLIDEGTDGIERKPVLESSNLFVTPKSPDEITSIVEGIPAEHQGTALVAIQATINYINSKE